MADLRKIMDSVEKLSARFDSFTRKDTIVYPKDLKVGDKIFDRTYGYLVIEQVKPFDPKYPKSQIVETDRGRRDLDPERPLSGVVRS